MSQFFERANGPEEDEDASKQIGPCHACGCNIRLIHGNTEPACISCSGSPLCHFRLPLPHTLISAKVSDETCTVCQHGIMSKVDFR